MDEGYNPAYGARPLRRAIMRLLEDSMAERMLAGDIKARAFIGRICVACSLLSIQEQCELISNSLQSRVMFGTRYHGMLSALMA